MVENRDKYFLNKIFKYNFEEDNLDDVMLEACDDIVADVDDSDVH